MSVLFYSERRWNPVEFFFSYPDEIFVVPMSQIETFTVGVVLQDFHQQLLANEDITAVQFRTVIRGFEQLLSQSHGNEWVEVQTALIQSLQLKSK